jgi:DNA-binding NtrC family response regulator
VTRQQILVIDDDPDIRRLLAVGLGREGYEVLEAQDARSGLDLAAHAAADIVLLDLGLPDASGLDVLKSLRSSAEAASIIVITGRATVESAVAALQNGADNFVTKPLDVALLVALIRKAEEGLELRRRLLQHAPPQSAVARLQATRSPVVRRLVDALPAIARSEGNVLITGESGTGKSLVARAIHELSPRTGRAFLELNCASLSRELLESELFGHAAGAFTGAVRNKPGLFEVAHEGTLFLDEIGDMDIGVQPKLLKAIEDRRIRRLGSVHEHDVDVRILAATHFDLERLVREGSFRSDLFFRLDVLRVRMPPLRERREDIALLALRFLEGMRHGAGRRSRGFSDEAIAWLRAQPWPGNVRELHNVVERGALLSGDGVIRPAHLGVSLAPEVASAPVAAAGGDLRLSAAERRHIAHVLERTGGNKSEAARLLGITRQTLLRKLRSAKLPAAP